MHGKLSEGEEGGRKAEVVHRKKGKLSHSAKSKGLGWGGRRRDAVTLAVYEEKEKVLSRFKARPSSKKAAKACLGKS